MVNLMQVIMGIILSMGLHPMLIYIALSGLFNIKKRKKSPFANLKP
jgi:hypothetical protein